MRHATADESGLLPAAPDGDAQIDLGKACHDILNVVASLQVNVDLLASRAGSPAELSSAGDDARDAVLAIVRLVRALRVSRRSVAAVGGGR
jgi:hypothetical protein